MAGLFDQVLFQPDTFQGLSASNVFQKCIFQANLFQTDICTTLETVLFRDNRLLAPGRMMTRR